MEGYTEELYKEGLKDPDNHNGVITHVEPDMLDCETKWALGSITMKKASGGNGIPVELFQIVKDDANFKCYTQYASNLENSAVATGLEEVSFHSNPKECSIYCTVALISHTSEVMLKIPQARLQQYVNCEVPDFQAGFRKGRGTKIKLPTLKFQLQHQSFQ